MSEKIENERELIKKTQEIQNELEKRLAEITVTMNKLRKTPGKISRTPNLKSIQEILGEKYSFAAKNIAAAKIEHKLDDICKDMERTDKKVAKLKKKLMSEI